MKKLEDDSLNIRKLEIIKKIIANNQSSKDSNNYSISYEDDKIMINCLNEKNRTKLVIDDLIRQDKDTFYYKLFPKKNRTVLDCTAGLGRDGIMISKLGYDVTMIERNPILILLINNFLKRNVNIKAKLFYGDSLSYITSTKMIFDYIYIDFMFDKKKKSKPSKYDSFLRSMDNHNVNKIKFIENILKYCKDRVIVKEPIKSDSNIVSYDFEIKTKLIRYKIFHGKAN